MSKTALVCTMSDEWLFEAVQNQGRPKVLAVSLARIC